MENIGGDHDKLIKDMDKYYHFYFIEPNIVKNILALQIGLEYM